jgi:hypothetical protein
MRNGQLCFLELVPFRRFDSCTKSFRRITFALSIAAKQHLSTAISAGLHKPASDAISIVWSAVLPVRVLNRFVFGIQKGLADDDLDFGVRDLPVRWVHGRIGSNG